MSAIPMAKPGQSSFRRTLLSCILLLSIPVLLVGEFMTYRKTRSGMLETARYNLTASAIKKGESIQNSIESLRASLATATETSIIQQGSYREVQTFVYELTQSLSTKVQCIQLIDLQSKLVAASTCGTEPVTTVPDNLWSSQRNELIPNRSSVQILPSIRKNLVQGDSSNQLSLILSAPVYTREDTRSLPREDLPPISRGTPLQSSPSPFQPPENSLTQEVLSGKLRYALVAQVTLHQPETVQLGSLAGQTVVLDQGGTILAHPEADRLGRNIRQEADADRLVDILVNALAGRRDTLHLFSFRTNGTEWLAGYAPITIPVSANQHLTWVVLSVTPINNALYGLADVKQVLVILTIGLIIANVLATIYMTRDLAMPLEQLSDYALRINHRLPSDRAPKNFKIRELNQLAEALDSMVQKLEDRAEELEAAWQEAQAANQLKSEFLATTSHELRTPLNAIIGCIQLVRDGCCDDREEEMEFLLQANDAAMHLLKIINDLLDISKIEAGKVELNLQPVSIQDLCEQCIKMIQPAAEKKRLSIAMEVDPRLDRVPLDERRVRQMVINLMSNAVKFTPEGGQVRLSGKLAYGEQLAKDIRPDHSPVNPSTPYLCLEVADSGIGIPEDRWHLLFRPFQQADSSLTRKHEGTGLGLALTKRLTELHGGTISFFSVQGKGSTFRIWLPSRETISLNGAGAGKPAQMAASSDRATATVSQNPISALAELASGDRPSKPES